MATMKQKYRVTGITGIAGAGPNPATPGEPIGVNLTLVPVRAPLAAGQPAPPAAGTITLPVEDPAAAEFFSVNSEIEVTFAKAASGS